MNGNKGKTLCSISSQTTHKIVQNHIVLILESKSLEIALLHEGLYILFITVVRI